MSTGPAHRRPTERAFGLSVGAVLCALGAFAWWRGSGVTGAALGVTGSVLVVLGLTSPAWLRVPSRVWWRVAGAIGWVNARVLLTLLFVVVMTPVGYVLRMTGHNPLGTRRSNTNWGRYPARCGDRRHYERQF